MAVPPFSQHWYHVQAEAEMHDEFFGHCIAGFRFGGTLPQIVGAVDIAFEVAGSREAKQVSTSYALLIKLQFNQAHVN